jgi:hypothetical protein
MSRWHRILILPAILGLALAFMGLSSSSASAQTYYFTSGSAASVSCPGWPASTCTVTLDQYVPAGQSVQATLPGSQADLTVNCTNGCFPGETFSVTVSPSLLARGVQQYVNPGSCVNGSYYLNQYGCTSAFISIPPMSAYAYTYTSPSFAYSPPAYAQPPVYYASTPTYSNGYWWQWDNDNNGWQWSHHGNHWHPWNH